MASHKLIALLPPHADMELNRYTPVARAVEEARYYRENARRGAEVLAEVRVCDDPDLTPDQEVIELIGSGVGVNLSISMPCRVPADIGRYCTLHMKDIGRFCGIELTVEDGTGATKHLLISNKQARIRIKTNSCSMPLVLSRGWNIVVLDLADIVKRAFGTHYMMCTFVAVHASVRIARCYFSSARFEDAELPSFLRTIRHVAAEAGSSGSGDGGGSGWSESGILPASAAAATSGQSGLRSMRV